MSESPEVSAKNDAFLVQINADGGGEVSMPNDIEFVCKSFLSVAGFIAASLEPATSTSKFLRDMATVAELMEEEVPNDATKH